MHTWNHLGAILRLLSQNSQTWTNVMWGSKMCSEPRTSSNLVTLLSKHNSQIAWLIRPKGAILTLVSTLKDSNRIRKPCNKRSQCCAAAMNKLCFRICQRRPLGLNWASSAESVLSAASDSNGKLLPESLKFSKKTTQLGSRCSSRLQALHADVEDPTFDISIRRQLRMQCSRSRTRVTCWLPTHQTCKCFRWTQQISIEAIKS